MRRLLNLVVKSEGTLFIVGFLSFGLVMPLFAYGRDIINLGLVAVVGVLFSGLVGGIVMLLVKYLGDRIMR